MTEQFCEILNLSLPDLDAAVTYGSNFVCVADCDGDSIFLTVPEARALRDWLNRALPEEVCAVRTDAGGNIEPGTCTCGAHK